MLLPAANAFSQSPTLLLHDGFDSANGANGLITNEYAAWHSWDPAGVDSPIWQSDGGSLFSVPAIGPDGALARVAYTGELDNEAADLFSEGATHSDKVRFWTKASGFEDVRVASWIKPLGWGSGVPSTWGGFKFYLRREEGVTDSPFYTAEPYIYDGHAYIQKKCADGSYYMLAQVRASTAPIGSWQQVAASSKTEADGSVTISLYRDGALLLRAVDRGTGCAPLRGGHVGFRSDFFSYYLEDFDVTDEGSETPPPEEEPPVEPPVEEEPPAEEPEVEPPPRPLLLHDGFASANGANGLITNEYAAWYSWDPAGVDSPIWQSDGGSLFSVPAVGPDGGLARVAYTGALDNEPADVLSVAATHSDKMRFWTKASGFEDVRVASWIKPLGWGAGVPSTWGGFKFYLRREQGVTDSPFYTAEPYIYDGHAYIQKKCADGSYYMLAQTRASTAPIGSWHPVAASSKTEADGSVTISLYRDGALLLRAVDRGTGCAPLRGGHVGFRSDFFRYYLDGFDVTAEGSGTPPPEEEEEEEEVEPPVEEEVEPPPPASLLRDGFDSANGLNGLITNEYAAWHSSDPAGVDSPIWQSDGGSLFSVPAVGPTGAMARVAYTGELDNQAADLFSAIATHSDKMRFWTKASGFENVRVASWIKPLGWGAGVPTSWGGFKFYLRREKGVTDSPFYTAEPYIYDGHAYIQKKCLGNTGGGNFVPGEGSSPGGTYYTLASARVSAPPIGSWHPVSATTRTQADGSVEISLYRDGALLLRAVDRGTGCAPLRGGHVGFRSDFFRYYLEDFEVTALP
jgi:roadblock/LC7 domain-containing protein